MNSFSVLAFLIFLVAALILSFAQTKSVGLGHLGSAPSLKVGIGSFLATAAGVVLSYFAIHKHFEISGPNIAGVLAICVIANYGSYVALKDKNEFDWQDCLLFVKDGFMWATAYPAVAAALGLTGFKFTA
jgi:hypothetical protein